MKTKFRADRRRSEIYPIKIIRETESNCFIEENGKQWKETKKNGDWFDSYQDAKIYLLDESSRLIEFYQSRLQSEINKLKQIIEL